MNTEEMIGIEEKYSFNVYKKLPFVLTKGQGAIVQDSTGKNYIDFYGGHAVALAGHCHPRIVKSIKNQLEKLIFYSNICYNDARAEALDALAKITPKSMKKVFFSNSGSEANETSIKLARIDRKKPEIIAMEKGFHGRTLGSLSATWGEKYQNSFKPLVPGFKFVEFGNIDHLKANINDKTAAVILECIQGVGGTNVVPDDYMKSLREICDENDILLIIDEIQTGPARTGKMFAHEHWGIEPDIMSLAKGIAGGFPMGVTIAREEIADSMTYGTHASTFGGNPLACAACKSTIDVIIEEKLPERAKVLGEVMKKDLVELAEDVKFVKEIRGLGLMLGMDLEYDASKIMKSGLEKGLIVGTSTNDVLRFLPPLIIEQEIIKRGIGILKSIFQEINQN